MVNSYLHRLYDTVISRGYIEVEQLTFDNWSNRRGTIRGRLKFHDGSLLDFGEVIILRNRRIVKLRYAYHYQNASDDVVFRYDNAPHYPNLPTHLIINMLVRPLSQLKFPISARFSMRLNN